MPQRRWSLVLRLQDQGREGDKGSGVHVRIGLVLALLALSILYFSEGDRLLHVDVGLGR